MPLIVECNASSKNKKTFAYLQAKVFISSTYEQVII